MYFKNTDNVKFRVRARCPLLICRWWKQAGIWLNGRCLCIQGKGCGSNFPRTGFFLRKSLGVLKKVCACHSQAVRQARCLGEADKLMAEFEEAGITHGILKAVRGVIETPAAHLLRIAEKA